MTTPKTPTATPTVDTSKWTIAGRNVRYTTMDGLLFIAVAVDDKTIAASPTSKSGKSKSVGSTEGNISIAGTSIKVGVNAYQPV